MKMTPELERAIGMWGIALCVLAAAAGWMFMRFGQAWSVADLPESGNVVYIVPAYIISEIAMIPLGAKLADMWGCKRAVLPGLFLFVVGAMLCVVSVSVEMLITFRLVMGLGGGLLLGLAFTSVGRYYEKGARGKCHELMTAAFAIGSLFGTAVGYFFVENFNWRMGFVILSIAVMIGSAIAYRFLPRDQGEGVRMDPVNTVLVVALFGVAAFYSQEVNVDFELISWPSLAFIAVIVALLVAAMRNSKTSPNPLIPRGVTVMEKKMIFLMFAFSMCGLGLIQYFFKLYLVYYEFDIYVASMMFALLIAGAAGPSILGSRKVLKTGVRPWIVVGAVLVTVALVLTHFIADKGVAQFGLSLFMFGLGLGCIVTQLIISLQSFTPREKMGQHTGNLMAVRMAGIVVGNAFVGAYMQEVKQSGHVTDVIDISATSDLLGSIAQHILGEVSYAANALNDGFTVSVVIMAVVTALLAVVAFTLGDDDKLQE
ncbi:MAG: MFS transporter [Candidatus Methanomethylophilaceae archaeon]|nr:MFS transporter [Candidatus Methanomethylophilaceae archaeon]